MLNRFSHEREREKNHMFQPSNEIYRTVHLALFTGNNEPLDYIMPITHFSNYPLMIMSYQF